MIIVAILVLLLPMIGNFVRRSGKRSRLPATMRPAPAPMKMIMYIYIYIYRERERER